MINVPEEYRQYYWIANKFSKIKGVVNVTLDHTPEGMNLFMDNGKKGGKKKTFEFPLRRLFFVDYANAKDVQNAYDVMEIEDPNSMVELGFSKAHVFFNDIVLPAAEDTGE